MAIIREHLQMNGFTATLTVNGEDCFGAFEQGGFDFCGVDIMMPKMDGFTFTRKVRRLDNNIPIIFQSANSLKEDKIEGIKMGCDDYITKPFTVEELFIRIRAVLKRSAKTEDASPSSLFEIGN